MSLLIELELSCFQTDSYENRTSSLGTGMNYAICQLIEYVTQLRIHYFDYIKLDMCCNSLMVKPVANQVQYVIP